MLHLSVIKKERVVILFGQDCDFGSVVGTLEPWTKPTGSASKEDTLPHWGRGNEQ